MKILGIVGSQRKKGNTSALVQEALKPFKDKKNPAETELIFLGDYNIKSCTGCEGCKDTLRCVIDDDMQKIYPLITEADALILGSPTYFYNVSADIKAFIDRCYCFVVFHENDRSVWLSVNEALGGKYAAVIAVCEQHQEEDMGYTAVAMEKSLESLGYRVVSTVKTMGAFAAGDVLKNEGAMQEARLAGEKLQKTLKLRDNLTSTKLGDLFVKPFIPQ